MQMFPIILRFHGSVGFWQNLPAAMPHKTCCFTHVPGGRDEAWRGGAVSTLDRILNTAADNLTVAKVLVQLGLDPNNVTSDALFNRLLEIVLPNITLANMFALVGAIFFVATLVTQTMVPLRVANMTGCAFFAGFGALAGDVKTFLLYLLFLPINAYRLRQMLGSGEEGAQRDAGRYLDGVAQAVHDRTKYRKGDILFKKGDQPTKCS